MQAQLAATRSSEYPRPAAPAAGLVLLHQGKPAPAVAAALRTGKAPTIWPPWTRGTRELGKTKTLRQRSLQKRVQATYRCYAAEWESHYSWPAQAYGCYHATTGRLHCAHHSVGLTFTSMPLSTLAAMLGNMHLKRRPRCRASRTDRYSERRFNAINSTRHVTAM